MKNKIILMFLALFVMASCKDKDMPTEPDGIYFGSGSADLNGNHWEGDTRTKLFQSCNNGMMNIVIDEYRNGVLKSDLIIQAVPLAQGAFEMQKYKGEPCDSLATSFNTSIGDGDVAGNYYILLTNDTVQDWIEIVAFDDATMEFNGKFQASFYRDTTLPKFDQSLPDTLVFTNGTFNGKITK
ncbi:MAG: hypothetical protein D6714_07390 [Bacteroidetes bacterium]|nr:MAG: hypothetical protein D6714_07390 [Bacteroidota bacterium]